MTGIYTTSSFAVINIVLVVQWESVSGGVKRLCDIFEGIK